VQTSWGEPLAAFVVLVARYGSTSVDATDVLSDPGSMVGAIQLQAALEFDIPDELLGIVQLDTKASINGQGSPSLELTCCFQELLCSRCSALLLQQP
jgi:hypothetical protein